MADIFKFGVLVLVRSICRSLLACTVPRPPSCNRVIYFAVRFRKISYPNYEYKIDGENVCENGMMFQAEPTVAKGKWQRFLNSER